MPMMSRPSESSTWAAPTLKNVPLVFEVRNGGSPKGRARPTLKLRPPPRLTDSMCTTPEITPRADITPRPASPRPVNVTSHMVSERSRRRKPSPASAQHLSRRVEDEAYQASLASLDSSGRRRSHSFSKSTTSNDEDGHASTVTSTWTGTRSSSPFFHFSGRLLSDTCSQMAKKREKFAFPSRPGFKAGSKAPAWHSMTLYFPSSGAAPRSARSTTHDRPERPTIVTSPRPRVGGTTRPASKPQPATNERTAKGAVENGELGTTNPGSSNALKSTKGRLTALLDSDDESENTPSPEATPAPDPPCSATIEHNEPEPLSASKVMSSSSSSIRRDRSLSLTQYSDCSAPDY